MDDQLRKQMDRVEPYGTAFLSEMRLHLHIQDILPSHHQVALIFKFGIQAVLAVLAPWEFLVWLLDPRTYLPIPEVSLIDKYLELMGSPQEAVWRQSHSIPAEYQAIRDRSRAILVRIRSDLTTKQMTRQGVQHRYSRDSVMAEINISASQQSAWKSMYDTAEYRRLRNDIGLQDIRAIHSFHDRKPLDHWMFDMIFMRALPRDVVQWLFSAASSESQRQNLAKDYLIFVERHAAQEATFRAALTDEQKKSYDDRRTEALQRIRNISQGTSTPPTPPTPPASSSSVLGKRKQPAGWTPPFPSNHSDVAIEAARILYVNEIRKKCWMESILMNQLLIWLGIHVVLVQNLDGHIQLLCQGVTHLTQGPFRPFGFLRHTGGTHFEAYYFTLPPNDLPQFTMNTMSPATIQRFNAECVSRAPKDEFALLAATFGDALPETTIWNIQRTQATGDCFYHALFYILAEMEKTQTDIAVFRNHPAFKDLLRQADPAHPQRVIQWLRDRAAQLVTRDIYLQTLHAWDATEYTRLGLPLP